MSCQHGNHVDDCDLCNELLSEYRSGVEIGKKEGWEACESCHGIVDGKHVELESLRQQLEQAHADIAGLHDQLEEPQIAQDDYRLNKLELEQLRKQLAEREKYVKLLRDAIHDGCLCIAQYGEQPPDCLLEALAATADLKDVILCHAEPVAYRTWYDEDNRARWLFTLWPQEERLDVEWEPIYRAWEPKP